MNKTHILTKPLKYKKADGSGRDTYCFNIQINEHERMLGHYKAESMP